MNKKILLTFLILLITQGIVLGSVSVSTVQSGADSGTVMAGQTFTITASGWLGDCTSGYLDLSECSVCNVSESQTKTISGSSVSWTTLSASKASNQRITVSVSGTCSPDFGSSTFDVITSPSLSATVSPSSASVAQGSTFSFSLNVQNNGETTANFGTISVSPSDFSVSSGCSPSSIAGSESSGITCTIQASDTATVGSNTLTITISPSNADSITKTVDVTVSASTPTTTTGSSGSGAGDGSAITAYAVKIWSVLYPETPVSWIIDKADIAITQIDIVVKDEIKVPKLTVNNLSSKPSSVGVISDEVYQYLNITPQNILESDLGSVKLTFRVEKTWIADNNIDENTVNLNRYHNGVWNELSTIKSSEDENYIYYQAETPGFSIFAITGKEVGYQSDIVTTTTIQETTTTVKGDAGIGEKIKLPIWLPLVVFLMIIVGIGLVLKGKREEHNKELLDEVEEDLGQKPKGKSGKKK